MPEPSELPWDERPVTPRDLVITGFAIAIAFGFLLGVFFLGLQGEPAAAEAVPPAAIAQEPVEQPAAVDDEKVDRGREVFQQSCSSCHTIGEGRTVGPDLKGVTETREQDWLLEWIQKPDEMLAEGDPIAVELLAEFNNIAMPNLGIAEDDALALIEFVRFESGGAIPPADEPSPADEPPPVQIVGDVQRGEAFFTGQTQLANAGPACMGCHSISGIGELGGGTLGPDLTAVSSRYGPTGLIAALEGLPFPTMQGVFAEQPLTPEEVADLGEFFIASESNSSTAPNLIFVGIGVAAMVVLGVLSHLIWRKRLVGVRIPLVGR
jgi:mono/diheme cytochrome c family protein